MTRMYLIVFEKGEGCWSAFAPDVAGTGGMGDSIHDARNSLREGNGYMLEYALEKDIPFPEAVATNVDFSEFDSNPAESHYEIEWLSVDLPERKPGTEHKAKQAA